MYKLKSLFIVLLSLLCLSSYAQEHDSEGEGPEQEGEFIFQATPSKKEGVFKTGDKIAYDIKIQNSYNIVQDGTLSYLVTLNDKEVAQKSVKVKIGKKASAKYSLDVPSQKTPGFYKISVMLNVTEYDDTLRRVFGVNPQEIKSQTPKPADFDDFWATAKTELQGVKPNFKMTEQPDLEQNGISVYLIEAQSLGNIKIRGWLTIAKDRKPKDKVPVWMVLPGYGGTGVKPIFAPKEIAVLSWNVRGQGNSRDVVHPTREGYLTTDIENKNKYVLRGAIMDCIRGVDFICSRAELDSTNIICTGGSMGGYFSIVTCSLDSRIKLCSANNPVFCDWRTLVGSADWPMSAITGYSKNKFIPMKRLLDNLDYFDLKNFAPNLKCKSLIGISLLDNLAPPQNEYAMLNNITRANYKLFVFPDLAHEVPPSLFSYLSSWMMDEFGVF